MTSAVRVEPAVPNIRHEWDKDHYGQRMCLRLTAEIGKMVYQSQGFIDLRVFETDKGKFIDYFIEREVGRFVEQVSRIVEAQEQRQPPEFRITSDTIDAARYGVSH